MKFYYFHLMPYIIDHDEPSSWVTLSNRHYDPALGHTLYNQYLDQLEAAERLGWDGLCVNEHHQNCYGTMPSPNVMAAMLVRRTSRAKIAILGNGLPLRENPLRIAEEIAVLDVASGGRQKGGFMRRPVLKTHIVFFLAISAALASFSATTIGTLTVS